MTKPQDELLRRHIRNLTTDTNSADSSDVNMHRNDYLPVPSSPGLSTNHTQSTLWPTIRLSVVDNLLPPAHAFLMTIYDSSHKADLAWEWIVASRIYGLAAGCFLSVFLANQPSRKVPLITALALNFFGGAVSGLIMHVPHGVFVSCLGRFINGVGSGIAQVIGLAMIADISPIRLRGTMLATATVWACIGELIGMLLGLEVCLGSESLWHIALIAPNLIIIPALVVLVMAAESPRCLLLKGDKDGAIRALQFYQNSDDWQASLADFSNEFRSDQYAETERLLRKTSTGSLRTDQLLHSIKKRFHSGSFLRPLLLGSYVLTFVHIDDWLWISYSTQVFENIGWSAKSATTTSLFIVIPQAIVSVLTLCFFDSFSRRTLIILPTVLSIFSSILAIIGLTYGHLFGIIPVSLIVPVLAAVDLSAAAVASESAYSVTTELFMQRDRVLGGAIIGILQNCFGGILTATLLTVVNTYGTQFVLAPFILTNIVYIFVLHKSLPETNGISATAIAKQFRDEIPAIFNYNLLSGSTAYFFALYGRGRIANLFLFIVQISMISIMFYLFAYSGKKLLFSS
ncbi:MFS domain-containing protein [Aphelenchoides besseyi]|nr:MFS domain-containing protein [Aphelenchoides besseyi]